MTARRSPVAGVSPQIAPNIYRKLGVSNRTRASRIAARYNPLSWMPYVPFLAEL